MPAYVIYLLGAAAVALIATWLAPATMTWIASEIAKGLFYVAIHLVSYFAPVVAYVFGSITTFIIGILLAILNQAIYSMEAWTYFGSYVYTGVTIIQYLINIASALIGGWMDYAVFVAGLKAWVMVWLSIRTTQAALFLWHTLIP